MNTSHLPLAVVGAHMSGMALNHELVSHGATLVKAAQTAPTYRLFALPGALPRPGLLRVASGGASLALEVWTLPTDGFARFVAAIPAPLGIGTLILSDGEAVKGFLVEHAGTLDAEDITAFGGWRAYAAERLQKPTPTGAIS
jgi:allophanate hydrolase